LSFLNVFIRNPNYKGKPPYHPKKQKNKNLKSKCHWWENPPPVKTYGFPIKDFGNDRKEGRYP